MRSADAAAEDQRDEAWRVAYDATGRIDDRSARIERLIATHRRKHKLRPMLEALRFGG